jgi:hypothetical protein
MLLQQRPQHFACITRKGSSNPSRPHVFYYSGGKQVLLSWNGQLVFAAQLAAVIIHGINQAHFRHEVNYLPVLPGTVFVVRIRFRSIVFSWTLELCQT